MANSAETILSFHETKNFGTRENLVRCSQDALRAYRAVSTSEIAALVETELNHEDREAEILTNLACLRPGSLVPFHEQFIEKELFFPGVVFHAATESTAEKLVSIACRSTAPPLLRQLLPCIAWAGNRVVQDSFSRWRVAPPEWSSELLVPPHGYAAEAGWELTATGTRKDLFGQFSFPLVARDMAREISGATVSTASKHTCPWCGRHLVSLLKIDPASEALMSLEWGTTPLDVLTCSVCCCFGTIFSRVGASGDQQWHPANSKPSYLPDAGEDFDPVPEHALVLSGQTRHCMTTANWLIVQGVSFSQVGGLPTWIQDAEYPGCADCARTMKFIGQISNQDYDPSREGIYYCFACFDCGVTAANFQQS